MADMSFGRSSIVGAALALARLRRGLMEINVRWNDPRHEE
jgi:hypothetical protein